MAAFRPAVLGSRALGTRPVAFSRTRLPARPVRPLALVSRNMGSSKGKPTDPELREKVVEDVKQETNKDGSGKGQMAGWKAGKIAKRYEAEGGDYENQPGSKNKPKKGSPEHKDETDQEKHKH